jgi:hypothetical protein
MPNDSELKISAIFNNDANNLIKELFMFNSKNIFMAIIVSTLLYGCGGGGSGSGTATGNSIPTSAQVSAISAAQIASYSDSQIVALDVNIQFLSSAALNALSPLKSTNNPAGQIESISPTEISVLTPAQVRMIGAASGGSITTSQIRYLNSAAWLQLATDSPLPRLPHCRMLKLLGWEPISAHLLIPHSMLCPP